MASSTAVKKDIPKDAQAMQAILKEMGITDYEPRLVNIMLEFSYRYLSDVLDDAKAYSTHAGKKTIESDDVKLAIETRMDYSFSQPPPRDLLVNIAKQKNSQPLPVIKPYTGMKLPPDRFCLTGPNFRLKSDRKVRMVSQNRILQSPLVRSGSSNIPTIRIMSGQSANN